MTMTTEDIILEIKKLRRQAEELYKQRCLSEIDRSPSMALQYQQQAQQVSRFPEQPPIHIVDDDLPIKEQISPR